MPPGLDLLKFVIGETQWCNALSPRWISSPMSLSKNQAQTRNPRSQHFWAPWQFECGHKLGVPAPAFRFTEMHFVAGRIVQKLIMRCRKKICHNQLPRAPISKVLGSHSQKLASQSGAQITAEQFETSGPMLAERIRTKWGVETKGEVRFSIALVRDLQSRIQTHELGAKPLFSVQEEC